MKDVFGVDLAIGDIVAFNPPRYKGLITGKVVAFTTKMVRVEYAQSGEYGTTVCYPFDTARQSGPAPAVSGVDPEILAKLPNLG